MRELLRKHHISLKNAWSGLWWALTTQPNFRVHALLSLLALFLSWYFAISSLEFSVVIFTICLGFTAEMINTAFESMTDLITTEWKQEAKIAKDVAAGMMLTVAITALIIAWIIFWPHIRVVLHLGT